MHSWLRLECIYIAWHVEVELVLLDFVHVDDAGVLEQRVGVGIQRDQFLAYGADVLPVVVGAAARLGDTLVALRNLRRDLVALLLEPGQRYRCFSLFALRRDGALLFVGLLKRVVEIGQPVSLRLVFGLEPADLAVNPRAVLFHETSRLRRITVGVVMHEHPHHVLGAQLVLGGELAVVPGGIDQQNPIPALHRPPPAQDQQARGHSCAVEDVERQRDDGVDQSGLEQRPPNEMLVVGLAPPHLGFPLGVEVACLFLDFRLASEEHALRADDASPPVVGERSEDVKDERVVPEFGRWRLEAGVATKTTERVFVPLPAEGFLLEPFLSCLVVGLLFRLQPPVIVREREIGEHQREPAHLSVFEKLRVGDGAVTGPDVGFEAVEHRVDLADGGVAPVHLLREVARMGREIPVFAEVVGGVHQHPAGARGRIVDRIAGARMQDAHQGVYHLRGREELARLRTGVVGELLD